MIERAGKRRGFTHDDKDNLTVDWWTPPWIFDRLAETFDMDVAAPEGGVPWIPANTSLTLAEDGLATPWAGFVWCNPPYGRDTPHWLAKFAKHGNGVALVFARTDCAWFHDYCAGADILLFLRGRVKFVDGLGKTKGSGAGAGSMLVGYGDRARTAVQRLGRYGLMSVSGQVGRINQS